MILAVAAMALLVAVDQLIKYLVVRDFALGESRRFLHFGDTELMNLTYVRNDGAAFSSMSGQRAILIGLPVILLGVCIWAMWKYGRNSPFLKWNLTLVMAGGIGNLIDRIFRGGDVVDYLDIRLFHFAVFNFADCCICIGVFLILLYMLFDKSGKESHTEQPNA